MKNILFIAILIGLSACSQSLRSVEIIKATGEKIATFRVEIADDYAEIRQGLMYRDKLEKDKGMLFIFQDEKQRSFWMKNTLIPLDMIFADSSGKIISITKTASPCDRGDKCSSYYSNFPAQYVLEINGGLVDQLDISLGDKIISS